MSDITDFYQQQAESCASNITWLAAIQDNARADFQRLNFPTRKTEDWKYTSVESFLKKRFVAASAVLAPPVMSQRTDIDFPIQCHTISIVNGMISDVDSLIKNLPTGVLVLPLLQALTTHADLVKPHLDKILKTEHAFHALNTAMMQCGVFIYLPKDVVLDLPILISHWQDKNQQANFVRHLIVAEENSVATVIEDYQGETAVDYFTSVITEVHLAAHASVTHYKVQRESKQATHIAHLAVNQSTKSEFNNHSFSFGGKLVRCDITFNLQERKAHCSMNGVYAPADGQHVDHHTVVKHLVADCTSAQDYKGILTGRARAVFNGKVIVAKDAQHTDAKQQNKNLLLSLDAEIDTKPQLEIFADDVVCTHGATVGQLDEDALFYLATRGIEHAEASQYLIQAFAAENLRVITDKTLLSWLSSLLNKQIK